jgi:hypothetical protein
MPNSTVRPCRLISRDTGSFPLASRLLPVPLNQPKPGVDGAEGASLES